MLTITEQKEQLRESLQQRVHRDCIVCRSAQSDGFGIQFSANADGSVEGTFECKAFFQGYEGILHGGVICALLDAAMTHCLFARGKSGVTARLIVRFLHPVAIGHPAVIRARLCDYSPPLYVLEAELSQNGKVLTQAAAKFIDRE
jgi:acyl-coenzyme A thioesterase PaaI-like protein